MKAPGIVALFFACLAACGPMPGLDRTSAATGAFTGLERDEAAPWALRVTVIDVGQGDATLLETASGEAMLIDAGPAGAGSNVILPLLEARGISEIADIALTHCHADHTGGLAEMTDAIPITGAIHGHENDATQDDPPCADAGVRSADPGIPWNTLHAGDRLQLGDVDVDVVAADGALRNGTAVDPGDPPDENARSAALLITSGGFRMLVAADITGGGNDPPYQTPDVETALGPLAGDIDVLRVAHHGSHTSTNQAFLDATQPEVAIVSVGDGNDYFHPHASVIERLLNAGIAVFQTERGWLDLEGPQVAGGDITIEVDQDGEYRVILE